MRIMKSYIDRMVSALADKSIMNKLSNGKLKSRKLKLTHEKNPLRQIIFQTISFNFLMIVVFFL